MKFRDIIASAVANSFRSKLRTTLTVIAIFIGAFTLTITTAIGTGVSSYINTQVAAIGAPNVLTITKTAPTASSTSDGPAKYDPSAAKAATGGVGSRLGVSSVLTQSNLDTIAKTNGISDVNPIVGVSPDFIQYGSNGKYQLTINTIATLTKADLAAGAQLNNSSSATQVMLPTNYLSSLGLGSAKAAVGKSVTIGITDYLGRQHLVTATVVGIQNATLLGGGAGLNQHATTLLHSIQIMGKPANLTAGFAAATAHFDSGASKQQLDAIKKDLSNKGFTALTVADQIGSFETVINGIIGVLDAFAVIALIAAAFGIINTLLMSVQERTREIGLMKAMGMSGRKVYALFSSEAVFIGFLGSAIGAIIAIGIGSVISHVLARTVLSGLPGLQVMQFAPRSIVTIIIVVMLIAFLAGTLPARRASRQNPIDALRYE
jgi:putative ABC transport system permease protein